MNVIKILVAFQILLLFGCANAPQCANKSIPTISSYTGEWTTIDYKGWRKGDYNSSTIHHAKDNEIVWKLDGLAKSQSLVINGDTAISNKKLSIANQKDALLTAKNDTLFGYIATYSEELGTYHDTYVMVRKH